MKSTEVMYPTVKAFTERRTTVLGEGPLDRVTAFAEAHLRLSTTRQQLLQSSIFQ